MLRVLRRDTPGVNVCAEIAGWSLPDDAVWIDLELPTRDEELALERALKINLPTREEMAALEPSSRLYRENGATFMTTTLLSHSETDFPVEAPVTFVLTDGVMVTIRYAALRAFTAFLARVEEPPAYAKGGDCFVDLLDAVVERLAAILEQTAQAVEAASQATFNSNAVVNFRPLLSGLARSQAMTGKVRTSLASLARMLSFATLAPEVEDEPERKRHVHALQRDAQSLTEHSSFLSANVSFLLDAALGLISIQQNGIIKFFSVVAVVFLPPTLFASIWGMNFHHMWELDQPWGYPLAIAVMICSGLLPYWWFRRKGML